MAREHICQYANCHETTTMVRVNIVGDERPAFCSLEHAGLWLLRQSWIREMKRSREDAGRITAQVVIDLQR